ncbi:MAG: MASE1 domain-containing protein [Alphaproteobacteria bacterium]
MSEERSVPAAADRRIWRAPLVTAAAVCAAYLVGAELSWRLFGAGDIGLAFFPPAGVTFAAFVLAPTRRWPIVVAAIVAAELTSDLAHGLSGPVALGYATANALEPLVGGVVFRRLRPSGPDMGQRGGLLSLVAAGCIAGPVVGALVGGFTKSASSSVGWLDAGLHWWAGDGLGVLAIGAPVLACWGLRLPRSSSRLAEVTAAFGAVTAATLAAFWFWSVPPTFIVLPVLVFVALRYGTPGVTVASALAATAANISTAAGHGAFVHFDVSKPNQLVFTQLFLASTIATVWFLAIETSGRAAASAAQELERAARQRAEAATALGQLSASLLARPTVADVAEVAVDHVRRRYGAASAVLCLRHGDAVRWSPTLVELPPELARTLQTAPFHHEAPSGPAATSGGAGPAGAPAPTTITTVALPGGADHAGVLACGVPTAPHWPPMSVPTSKPWLSSWARRYAEPLSTRPNETAAWPWNRRTPRSNVCWPRLG